MQVYKSSNPGLGVRVYHMVYSNSCEEHKYLAGIRMEKESFERLIKERGASFSFPYLSCVKVTMGCLVHALTYLGRTETWERNK